MREFDSASYQNIVADPLLLEELIRYHRVFSDLDAARLATLPEVVTEQGKALSVSVDENDLVIGGATIQASDQRAYNGLFHVIDEVLLPPIELDG